MPTAAEKNAIQQAAPILRDFLTYTDTIRGKAKSTVREYRIDLTLFFKFMLRYKLNLGDPIDQIDIDGVTVDFVSSITLSDIYAYLSYMSSERGAKPSTRARKISAIRAFFSYMNTKANLIDHNPCLNLETPKNRPALPKFLSLEQSVEFLGSIEGKNAERDYCMILLFLTCGMRLSELCGLNLGSIRKDDAITVLGKGGKERVVYINAACRQALDDYLAVRATYNVKPADSNALFISRLGKRMGTHAVQDVVKKRLEQAGLQTGGLTTHKLRHTAATIMFRDGNVDLRTLQEILGHEQLNTTQIYTHVSNSQIKNAAAENPLAKIKKSHE